jgi:large subunit ribosomal protein L35
VKQKTHRGAAKRFRITKKGKVLHGGANLSHFLGKKSSSRKRRLRKTSEVKAERGDIKRLLGKR